MGYKNIIHEGREYYGRHVMIGAPKCNSALRDKDSIRKFIKELVQKIDMVAFGEPFVERFGVGEEIGISAVQLIETSAITIHTNDGAGDLYLDVFSCKDFKTADVIDMVYHWFKPGVGVDVKDILRQ